jgi:hypothetical protein
MGVRRCTLPLPLHFLSYVSRGSPAEFFSAILSVLDCFGQRHNPREGKKQFHAQASTCQAVLV